ncbi:MAG: hypothetical protein V4638_05450 [Bacteroidota bacterium]
MGKAFFISRLALSLIFIVVGVYFIAEVESARYDYILSSFSSYDYNNYSSSYASNEAPDLTFTAGLITLLYLLLMQGTNVFALVKIKTKTVKVLSIIGLAVVGILILINLLMLTSPAGMSYDEVGALFVLFAFGAIGFGIVYLVHAVRYEAKQH